MKTFRENEFGQDFVRETDADSNITNMTWKARSDHYTTVNEMVNKSKKDWLVLILVIDQMNGYPTAINTH